MIDRYGRTLWEIRIGAFVRHALFAYYFVFLTKRTFFFNKNENQLKLEKIFLHNLLNGSAPQLKVHCAGQLNFLTQQESHVYNNVNALRLGIYTLSNPIKCNCIFDVTQ